MATADGRLVMIHRADALAEVLAAIGGRFGALRVLPMHPRAGDPAHRIIVTGRKGSRAPLHLLPGLVLHGAGNAFLPAVGAVLRDGEALEALVEELVTSGCGQPGLVGARLASARCHRRLPMA